MTESKQTEPTKDQKRKGPKLSDDEFYSKLPGMSKCSKCGGWYDTYVQNDIFHKCEYPRATLLKRKKTE